jgi:hypothetical protein
VKIASPPRGIVTAGHFSSAIVGARFSCDRAHRSKVIESYRGSHAASYCIILAPPSATKGHPGGTIARTSKPPARRSGATRNAARRRTERVAERWPPASMMGISSAGGAAPARGSSAPPACGAQRAQQLDRAVVWKAALSPRSTGRQREHVDLGRGRPRRLVEREGC